ncbi:hypothetical protein G6M50_06705 [Agrobacterium rhizogenes]|nr:hypothetical protein [Rhizobium rhizogenes]NTJ77488.1 hypothetical protein [Rhizobium rhizogenes]
MSVHPPNPRQILVFLPVAAARTIVAKLEEHGYEAAAVSTVPEAFDALRSDRYAIAVATRPDIDLVRAIKSIPVINLEVFFHALPSDAEATTVPKCFDSKAFLQRVNRLSGSPPTRNGQRSADHMKAEPVRLTVISRWFAALTGCGKRPLL